MTHMRNGSGLAREIGLDSCKKIGARIKIVELEPHGDDRRKPALDGFVAKDVCWHPPSSILQDRVEILCSGDAEDQWRRLLQCPDRVYRKHRQDRRQEGITGYPELSRVSWGET